MDAITLLLDRKSDPKLEAPAPQGEALDIIMQAAVRAPDHAGLQPWRFVICEGEGLKRLGKVFAEAAIKSDMSERDQQRAPQLPTRAPMLIVAIAEYSEHEKVPWVEQVASASCAVHAMQMAAYAQGFAGIWRTGSYARNEHVRNAFNLKEKDELVGFLYLGTASLDCPPRRRPDPSNYFEFWK